MTLITVNYGFVKESDNTKKCKKCVVFPIKDLV